MTDLPSGWMTATLPDLVAADGLFVDGDWVETKDQDVSGAVRLTQLSDVGEAVWRDRSNRRMTTLSADRMGCTYLFPGDVLIARMPDPLGRSCQFPGDRLPCVTCVDVAILRPGTRSVNSRWLMWWLNTPQVRQQVDSYATGTTRRRISRRNLEQLRLPLPPLPEQRRIVDALEAHLSHLDAATTSVTRAKARLLRLDQSVLNFETAGPRSRAWSTLPLGELLFGIEAGKSFACQARPATNDEWGVIKVSAMTWGEFRERENKAVPAVKAVDHRYEIRPGDILVSRANTEAYVGAPVLVQETRPQLLLSDKSLRLRVRPEVNRDWLLAVLSSPKIRRQISKRSTGTKESMRNVSQAALMSVRLPVPPPDVQDDVALRVKRAMDGVHRLSDDMGLAATASTALRHSLLSSAFSGRLVPQDPSDEPAELLLKRIQAERATETPRTRRTRKAKATP